MEAEQVHVCASVGEYSYSGILLVTISPQTFLEA